MNKIFNWFKDPNNRSLQYILFLFLLIIMLVFQCNSNRNLKDKIAKEKTEKIRLANNDLAFKDSIHYSNVSDTTFRAQKLAYELTIKELKGQYSNLLGSFNKLKGTKIISVTNTNISTHDTLSTLPFVSNLKHKSFINLDDSVFFTHDNFLKMKINIPYSLKYYNQDSVLLNNDSLHLYGSVIPGLSSITIEHGIALRTGLFKDEKTGKVSIKIDTEYPNLKFTKIEGAIIDDNEVSRKVARSFRKQYGFGLSIGYGISGNKNSLIMGPFIGLSFNYSPKFLQFGK